MNKKIMVLAAACALSLGLARPSYADGVLGGIGSMIGATTGLIVGVPVGIVQDSVFYQPWKTSKTLATAFGDENGFPQKVVGTLIGVPVGFAYGIPSGAVHGGSHGWRSGWDKPFSTESYWVHENSK